MTAGQARLLCGVKAAVPIAVGYLPIAFSFGLLAHQAGLPVWTAALMSAAVYAGASQFAALAMLGFGAPIPEIVLATLFLNLRHLVLNLSLLPRLGVDSRKGRAAIAAGITDETFAVASFAPDGRVRSAEGMAGLLIGAWSSWLVGTLAGSWLAPLIPRSVGEAMGVMLPGLFIGLLVPALRRFPPGVTVVAGAMVLHLAARQVLPPGWALVVAIIGGSLIGPLLKARAGK
jgi:4-azaleucine resistance transporter AzlC